MLLQPASCQYRVAGRLIVGVEEVDAQDLGAGDLHDLPVVEGEELVVDQLVERRDVEVDRAGRLLVRPAR